MVYRFIQNNHPEFGLRWLLRKFKLSPNAYYNFKKNKKSKYCRKKSAITDKIAQICATIILKEGKAISQLDLIRRLNQVIRGWSNYHRHVVASQAFSYTNNTLYLLLQQWAKHRHPNKNKW